MNQQQAIEEIGKALGVLAYQVEQENLSGMFSKNSLIEDLFLPVFAILYSAPDLRNLNAAGRNYAHLDLADDTARFSMQITTDGSAAKVKKTLQGVIDDGLAKKYGRVVVFILQPKRPTFTKASETNWQTICGKNLKFNPNEDVVALPSLLSRIRNLSFQNILKIRKIIAESVIGENYVDVLSLVRNVSDKHLGYEQKTARYIPGVFIETRETKQLCRSFCHPSLFLDRSIESAGRIDLPSWNQFLNKSGVQTLDFPVLKPLAAYATLQEVEKHAQDLWLGYEPLLPLIKEYKHNGGRRSPLPNATPRQVAFYEMNEHVLTNEFQYIKSSIDDIREDFESSYKRVLLITGAAGQGKTNLLCDLYENFIEKHKIPCAFVSGRELGLKGSDSLAAVLRTHLFGEKFSTLEDGFARLSSEALKSRKPFVLIIDGLNEHRDIGKFSQQLEMVVDGLLAYPGVRFLFSCRTEFFEDRFSNLVQGVLKPQIMLCRSTESRLSDEAREELLSVYFEYFEVDGRRVAEHVSKQLTKDLLLLRFFCEGYGKRGKEQGYVQPDIRHFYRDELFALYLEQKLRKAANFLQTLTIVASPVSPLGELQSVLRLCLAYMLKRGQFVAVPFSEIPHELRQALYALLDEELIIRKDRSTDTNDPTSESVNFTFDELRDFLISKHLIENVFPSGLSKFDNALKRFSPQSSPIEGIQRFLFYASRKPNHANFLAKYKQHDWYTQVYFREVFSIDQQYLGTNDVAAIQALLAKRDWQSREVARALAVRWNPLYWPTLNLGILIDFVLQGGSSAYESLIANDFRRSGYNETPLVEQFCELAEVCAKADGFRERFSEFRELVRLLVFMLPFHTDSWWRSPALVALQTFLSVAAGEITEELLRFPAEQFPAHGRNLWRLLYEAMMLRRDDRILQEAISTMANLGADDAGLKDELERFIHRFEDEQ